MTDDTKLPTAIGMFIGVVGSFLVAGLLSSDRALTSSVNVALILMVVVVLAAAAGGRMAGAVSAVVATLSFDYFQTEPYHSLRIGSRNDVETALILLVAGLVVGQIAARAQAHRVAVESGRSELVRLERLATLAAEGNPAPEVVAAAETELQQLLALKACRFERPPYVRTLQQVERSGVVLAPKQLITVSRMGRRGTELPTEGVALPVLARGTEIGRFVLEPIPGEGASLEQRTVAVALADQVGAAFATQPPAAGVPSAGDSAGGPRA